jgi:hypothetical protein
MTDMVCPMPTGKIGPRARIFPQGARIGIFPIKQGKSNESDPAAMNAHYEMDQEEVLRVKLEVLRQEHRDLDEAIHAMETSGRADQLALRRLKKQKLHLKDQIARITDMLTPDIIA